MGVIGVAMDITDRVQAEEEVRRHSERLEETVQKRTARIRELEAQRLVVLSEKACWIAAETGGNVEELWSTYRELARRVGDEVIDLQEAVTGQPFERESLFAAMVRAFEGDPAHKCMGRSAPARLKRALEHAAAHALETPALKRIAQQTGND